MISVLVPYRPDGGWRDRAWEWIKPRWEAMPDVELIVESPGPGASPAEFNHPLAINRAAARASGDVFVIADADTAFSSEWVRSAALAVRWRDIPWIMPRYYDRIGRQGTETILSTPSNSIMSSDPVRDHYDVEWRGDSINWSGLVVVPRDGFDCAGGYDERIAWWGADDICFGLTMDALWGKHRRFMGSAIHLWHPTPPEHSYGHERHASQQELVDRYIAAAEDADAIREVRFK